MKLTTLQKRRAERFFENFKQQKKTLYQLACERRLPSQNIIETIDIHKREIERQRSLLKAVNNPNDLSSLTRLQENLKPFFKKYKESLTNEKLLSDEREAKLKKVNAVTLSGFFSELDKIQKIKSLKIILIDNTRIVFRTGMLYTRLYADNEERSRFKKRTGKRVQIGCFEITLYATSYATQQKPLIVNESYRDSSKCHWGVNENIPCLGEYDDNWNTYSDTFDIYMMMVLILDFLQNAGDRNAFTRVSNWTFHKKKSRNYKNLVMAKDYSQIMPQTRDIRQGDKVKIIDNRYFYPWYFSRIKQSTPKNNTVAVVKCINSNGIIKLSVNNKPVCMNIMGLQLL